MNNTLSIFKKSFTINPFLPRPKLIKRNWLKIGVVLTTGLGVAMISLVFIQPIRAVPLPSSEPPLLVVQTTTMERVNQYSLQRTFIGRVEAARSSDLGFELAGKISSIQVDEGDQVKKGQVLAYLDTDRLQAKRNELVSALNQTRANLKLADLTYRRYQKVVKSSGVSKHQLDEAKEHLRATQATVELARSRIKSIEIEIDKSTLHAPFNANITRRNADEGRVISAGSPVLRLQEISSPEIRVGIAGPILHSIIVGQAIPVSVGQLSLQTSVKAIVTVRDGGSRTVDVILSLQNPPSQLRTGDLARVELAIKVDQSGYWVPISALAEDERGTWSVYTLEDLSSPGSITHQRIHRRTIEIIHTQSERVFVQGFFGHEDQVVTGGLQRIVPGQLVQTSNSLARSDITLN